jgi:hypothetical protein
MKTKPDINAFLEGGAADAADKSSKKTQASAQAPKKEPETETSGKVHREQKIFRLPLDMINTLKREAYERSVKSGSRVTETELVEKALLDFFKKSN